MWEADLPDDLRDDIMGQSRTGGGFQSLMALLQDNVANAKLRIDDAAYNRVVTYSGYCPGGWEAKLLRLKRLLTRAA